MPSSRVAPAEAVARLWDKALVYVTGKGGSGKTTVAAALALAAARTGRRALICDLAGSRQVPDAFGDRSTGSHPAWLADDLWWLTIDPHEAMLEWMRRQPGGDVAAAVLTRSRAFGHFVDAAPGAKELITIGKVADLATSDAYDIVVADGPSTGHALGMLAAPETVARAAPVGPVGHQSRELHELLADGERTGYVGVTLPEEMAMHEILELERGLEDAVDRDLDLIIVNELYPDRFSEEEAERLRAASRHAPLGGPLHAALAEHRRARIHAERVGWLRERSRAPVITLPFLFTATLRQREYGQLADALARRIDDGERPPGATAIDRRDVTTGEKGLQLRA